MELFEKVLGVIEALIAFANLLVVIFIYNRDKKEKRKTNENLEKSKRELKKGKNGLMKLLLNELRMR